MTKEYIHQREVDASPAKTWELMLPGFGLYRRGKKATSIVLIFMFLLPLNLFWISAQEMFQFADFSGLDYWIGRFYLLVLFGLSFLLNKRAYDGLTDTDEDTGVSEWAIGARRLRRNPRAMIGIVILGIIYSIALLAPYLAPFDPTSQANVLEVRFMAPSLNSGYLLGTDGFGRDVLSRIIYGSRISLFIGFVSVTISVTIGSILGVSAGYFGGWIDSTIMRLVDLMLGFPRLFLILIVIAFVGPSIFWIIAVLGLTGWMGVARLVRGQVLSLKEQEYILASKALGLQVRRILFKHLIPNTMAPIIVYATLTIGNVILIEAGLSFLGLGVQPPTPSWGNIIDLGRKDLLSAWWIATFPGFAIVLTVVTFNIVGDALRDAFDPRLRD